MGKVYWLADINVA